MSNWVIVKNKLGFSKMKKDYRMYDPLPKEEEEEIGWLHYLRCFLFFVGMEAVMLTIAWFLM